MMNVIIFLVPIRKYQLRNYDESQQRFTRRVQILSLTSGALSLKVLPELRECNGCYRRSGDMASLDVPIGEDGEGALLDMVPDEAPSIESVIADRDLLDRLFARLRELDPDADTIIAMWMDDDKVSDRTIAKALGRPQRTFADQMKKYRTELRRIRGY